MRSRTGKRSGSVLVALVAVVAVLAMLTPASAAPSFVVAGPGNAGLPVYYTPFVVLQKGQPLNFVNLDIAPHDVRSTSGLSSRRDHHRQEDGGEREKNLAIFVDLR